MRTAYLVVALAACGLVLSTVVASGAGAVSTVAKPPHSCTATSASHYECAGIAGSCFVAWYDDDSDGNPYDENAHIRHRTCWT